VICQRCGVVEATVHFSDPGNSPRRFQWLCAQCADKIVSSLVGQSDQDKPKPDNSAPKAWDPTDLNSQIAQSKKGELLGKMFGLTDDGEISDDRACQGCGLRLKNFQQNGLLGCPQCYVDFRNVLRSFLSRLHGHKSHLGRIPGQSRSVSSPNVMIMRLRVDMEKAIAAEEFETAASLRDEIEKLKPNSTGKHRQEEDLSHD